MGDPTEELRSSFVENATNEIDEIATANEQLASMTAQEVADRMTSMREKIEEHNRETLQKIQAHGAQLDATFGLGARIEALVDLLVPEGTLQRAQYQLAIEVHLAAAFDTVLEQLNKPKLFVPEGTVRNDA